MDSPLSKNDLEEPLLGGASAINLHSLTPADEILHMGAHAVATKHALDGEWKAAYKPWIVLGALVVGLVTFLVPVGIPLQAHQCLALLMTVVVLWAGEALPLFATALAIPVPVVYFRMLLVPGMDGVTMTAHDISTEMAHQYMDPVVLLFLGGFTIAAALEHHGLSQRLADLVLKHAGNKPKNVLLAIMVLGVFLSMWISNVAAAVLCTSVMGPILARSRGSFPKVAILAIAFACNIGGMTTPISSPQNAIALSAVSAATGGSQSVSFVQWMAISVPISIILTLAVWSFLLVAYKPDSTPLSIPVTKSTPLTYRHYFILFVTTSTVIMWCLADLTEGVTGNIGITALWPVVAFFGTGLLSKSQFDALPWNILILMGGGMALGRAIGGSDLLNIIADAMGDLLEGQSTFVVLAAFCGFMAVVANAISSTVAAIIVLPIIATLGMEVGRVRLLTVLCGFMTSGAMALPVSSFPNCNSFAQCGPNGEQYTTAPDYMKAGTVVTLFSYVTMISVGYGVCLALGW